MTRNETIHSILQSLEDMLNDLNNDELYTVEDFIVNQCDDSYEDQHGNSPNLFRMTIIDNDQIIG